LGGFNAPINRQATAMTNEQSLHFLGKLTYYLFFNEKSAKYLQEEEGEVLPLLLP